MKATLEKILEEFDREFAINKGRKWILTKEEAKELKSFISQKFSAYAKEIVERERERILEMIDRLPGWKNTKWGLDTGEIEYREDKTIDTVVISKKNLKKLIK